MPESNKDVLIRTTNESKASKSELDSSPNPDVELDNSTKVEGAAVTPEESQPQAPAQEEGQEGIPSPQDVKPEVRDTRPIDNVAWEAKRKADELNAKFETLLQRLEQGGIGQQPQQPQYSKAQLLAWASAPDTTTEQRLWAYGEIEKMEKTERTRELQDLMRSTQEKTAAEARRTQGTAWVASAFPDMIVKDGFGNPVGWNHSHPVLMKANEYMGRNRTLQNDPEGFVAAVKMAAFDLGVQVNAQTQQRLDRTTGQLRKEQKKSLVSSGGVKPVENAEVLAKQRLVKLQEAYVAAQKAGKRDESSKLFAQIVKERGLNPFFNL